MNRTIDDVAARRPWRAFALVLGIVAIASILVYADGRQRHSGAATRDATAAPDSMAAIDAVVAFAAFTTERGTLEAAGNAVTSTARGLRRLAAALYGIANRTSEQNAYRYATVASGVLQAAITLETDDTSNSAEVVRVAFANASDALQDIQRARYPDLAGAVAELRAAAEAMRADRRLDDQEADIQRFFDRASDALRGMMAVGL